MNFLDPDMDSADGNGMAPLAEQREIGRFKIDYILGRGGMGEVYKAFDPQTGRTVAIKVLDTRGYEDADTLKRFERESQAALVLDHPNIARFYGLEHDAQQRPVIVMEYINGRGLDQILDLEPDMLFSTRVDYIIQTARGLENAYRRSIIHRDIKPGNLLIDGSGMLKIIDFGLAKSMWDNSNLTSSGLVVGTPRYISPEQGMGRNVDHRSDIYSLGATFYELVTGRTPFEGDTPLAIMMKHINAPLVPPYMINPKVPGDVSEIITKMMQKEPNQRYQDYEPLIRDLESAKIHRLAKERRTHGEMSGMNTVMMQEESSDEYNPPNYLTEGLVNVELPREEEAPGSAAKTVLLSLAGVVVLGIALLLLFKPSGSEGQPSVFGQKLAALFSKGKGRANTSASSTQLIQQDRENIQTTRARMEAVVSKLLVLGNKGQDAPTIAGVREKGLFNREQTSDAWGNDFYITDAGGRPTLVAPGRDGQDNTPDDFRMMLDGSDQKIPKALTAADLQ